MDSAEIVTVVIALLAPGLTAVSFWWLNARRGSLTAAVPPVYAFVRGFRLRLPIAVFNDGAVPLLVVDLRIAIPGGGTYEWQTTRTSLMPKENDGHEFAVPLSVKGRDTATIIAEFGGPYDWEPEAGASREIRLEALIKGEAGWTELVTFTWWAPPSEELMRRYIAHRNAPRPNSGALEVRG